MTRLFAPYFGQFLILSLIALFTLQCETEASGNDTLDDVTLKTVSTTDIVNDCTCLLAYPLEELSDAEIEELQFMREEEKLARDVYLRLNESWNVRVFANIASAEQRHMDAIKCLLDKYELADPVGERAAGEFANADLATLYTQLVAQGLASPEAAYRVGATIEDLDISDLQEAITTVDNEDIIALFNELERGSRNHMRAFTRRLAALDATYTPSYITPEAYEAIITSSNERGGQVCANVGMGNNNCTGRCSDRGNRNGNGRGNCDGSATGANNHGNGNCTGNAGGNNNGNGVGNCTGNGPGNNTGGNEPGNGNRGNGPGNGGN